MCKVPTWRVTTCRRVFRDAKRVQLAGKKCSKTSGKNRFRRRRYRASAAGAETLERHTCRAILPQRSQVWKETPSNSDPYGRHRSQLILGRGQARTSTIRSVNYHVYGAGTRGDPAQKRYKHRPPTSVIRVLVSLLRVHALRAGSRLLDNG